MIVLDTNVISEILRQARKTAVTDWFDSQPASEIHICSPVLAELAYGVERMPRSKRKDELASRVSTLVQEVFPGRVLSFDADAAFAYGEVVASREATGRPISVMDAMIAAIARSNRAMLATRNLRDFEGTGIRLIDPFTGRHHE
ncbi:MAG: type II toxin-antitoxin system VapC family toxin [Hyphomicrobiales bacterium]